MIRHSMGRALRLRRFDVPQPPFWCATAVSPYQGPRRSGVAVDWMSLRATAPTGGELSVSRDPVDMLQRERKVRAPWLIDACGFAEVVHGRGGALLASDELRNGPVVVLASTDGAVPDPPAGGNATLVLTLWPLDEDEIDARIIECAAWPRWGACIPLLHPVTTNLELIESLAERVAKAGGAFLTSATIAAEPAAMSALVMMSDDADASAWESIRDGSADSANVRSGGIVASAARRAEIGDRCPLPASRDNWSAAATLSAVADRLFLLDTDPELAWQFRRSAATVASLPKPLPLISESASLSIIEGLGQPVITALESWLAGREPALLTRFDAEWRSRYDPYR